MIHSISLYYPIKHLAKKAAAQTLSRNSQIRDGCVTGEGSRFSFEERFSSYYLIPSLRALELLVKRTSRQFTK
jgi:hypothetical protein